MTAILASVARVTAGVVLVLAVVTAVFWAAAGPQGPATLAFLAAEFAVVTGAVLVLAALAPQKGGRA